MSFLFITCCFCGRWAGCFSLVWLLFTTYILCFLRHGLSCSPGCPGTCIVGQAGLKLKRFFFFSASASWALGSKEYTTTPDLQLVFLTIQPHQFLDNFSFPSAWPREFFSINQEMLLFKYFLLNCSNLTVFPPEVLVRIQTPGQEAF